MRTLAQARRQSSRDKSTGRYIAHIVCELCGRNVGEGYYSDERCNTTGVGLVLHKKCASALAVLNNDAAYTEMLRRAADLSAVQRSRLVSAILEAEAKSRAGCVDLRFCRRGTGPLVGVYRNADSEMESDPTTPWTVVCEEHNACVCCDTRSLAQSTSTDTRNFCDDCRYGDDKPGVY